MTPDKHQRISDLFLAVRELTPANRLAALESSCGGDPELRAAVDALLACDSDPDGFLLTPVLDALSPRTAGETDEPSRGSDRKSVGYDEASRLKRQLPSRIGPFTIERGLGEGGMGTVYLARREKPRRIVALKVIRRDVLSNEAWRRFEFEADALARLQHPGIVQLYEAGVAEVDGGSQPYFAMEYVEGNPITQYIRGKPTTRTERLSLMLEVCEAVQHAHNKGVIHRDLKPGNILVDSAGRPKVLDFGVARAIDPDGQAATRVTCAGQLLGTLAYMSPEQVAAEPTDIDTRSDIYSLGVICFELLTGRLPFELDGTSFLQAARIVAEGRAIPLRQIDQSCSADLEAVVTKAIDKKPAQRYQSVAEFAADLDRYLKREPVQARRQPLVRQAVGFLRRYKRAAIGATTVVVALAVYSGYSVERLRRDAGAYYVTHGLLKTASGQFDEAAKSFEAALRMNPKNVLALANYAIAKKELYNGAENKNPILLTEADGLCDQALSIDPANSRAWNVKGVLRRLLGDPDGAILAYVRATALEPENSAAWANLASLLAWKNDLDGARSCLLRAVTAPSVECAVWRNHASMQLFDRSPNAAGSIAKALNCNEADPASWALQARIRLSGGDAAAALDDARTADRLARERDPKVKRVLALAHLRNEQWDQAAAQARLAIQLHDFEAFNRCIVAIANARLGRIDDARTALAVAGTAWPQQLRQDGDYIPSIDKGLLWFDTAEELLGLRHEAESLLER